MHAEGNRHRSSTLSLRIHCVRWSLTPLTLGIANIRIFLTSVNDLEKNIFKSDLDARVFRFVYYPAPGVGL